VWQYFGKLENKKDLVIMLPCLLSQNMFCSRNSLLGGGEQDLFWFVWDSAFYAMPPFLVSYDELVESIHKIL
jgi:hypothetical protein